MKSTMFEVLILLGIILMGIWFFRKNKTEGFQQNERFLLKTDDSIYDGFYSEIYDTLWEPKNRVKYEIDKVIKTIQPEPRFARMLDVGCGTGTFLKELKERGYQVRGIDSSQAMVKMAKQKDNTLDIVVGDIMEPMAYEHAAFTHIFCMDFTIYEMENKQQFFKNCYFWLQNNGYLILHLADLERFNALVPAAQPPFLDALEQLGPERIKKTDIDFIDFTYVSDYITKENQLVHQESFTDKKTGNVRQNERTLYNETYDEIMKKSQIGGFTAKGSFLLRDGPSRDAAQQIIILERTS